MFYLIVFDEFDGKEEVYTVRTYDSFDTAKKIAEEVMKLELASRVILCKAIAELICCEDEE